MSNKKDWPLTLYFDGQCPLCAREIKILNRHAAESRLLFIDISSGAFDAKALGSRSSKCSPRCTPVSPMAAG
jgi:predicted DCC family thiol-disulfide oxidoreductase YuxK